MTAHLLPWQRKKAKEKDERSLTADPFSFERFRRLLLPAERKKTKKQKPQREGRNNGMTKEDKESKTVSLDEKNYIVYLPDDTANLTVAAYIINGQNDTAHVEKRLNLGDVSQMQNDYLDEAEGDGRETDEFPVGIILKLPANTLKAEVTAKVFADNSLEDRKITLSMHQLLMARREFLDRVELGDAYDGPFMITEEGRRMLEELKTKKTGEH